MEKYNYKEDNNPLDSFILNKMNNDQCNRNDERILLNGFIYAVDDQGICHLFTNEILNMNETNDNSSKFLSTQPFTIIDLTENNFSSLHLFTNDYSTQIHSSPLQFSGHIASKYLNVTLINSIEKISSIKKKKKSKYRSYFHRLIMFKKQLKSYMKKKNKYKQQQQQSNKKFISNKSLQHSLKTSFPMNDFELIPDLSKRKYIYKDITLSNQNQINLTIFQCTQQSSSIHCFDSIDCNYIQFNNKNSISLPDRRIGLSRHHSIKQLHKIILD